MTSSRVTRLFLLPAITMGLAAAVLLGAALHARSPQLLQFVFTSDAHYGLTRDIFRGGTSVDSSTVNRALVASLNTLPGSRFPDDGGLKAGQMVGGLDLLLEGGDIANREEQGDDDDDGMSAIQSASVSWSQFVHDYVDGLRTVDAAGAPTRLLIVPGNHEASNAVGFYRTMQPSVDREAFIEIYNMMVRPPTPLTRDTFNYDRDRLFFVRDVGGVHFQFLQIWPDSAMRARMEDDLQHVDPGTPVFIVTHDQPDVEAKHFINPNGTHDINATDQFENLLADRLADGASRDLPSLAEQAQLEALLVRHPNIAGYFHGNSNWHQVYEWNGPRHAARIHVVRADSPMKGALSAKDETRLSFEVVTVDVAGRTMTVRECLWNARGLATAGVAWGDSVTVRLEPHAGGPPPS